MKKIFASLLILAALTSSQAIAHMHTSETLEIIHPWMWESIPEQKTAAIFMEIKNISNKDDILLSAKSDSADRIEIHSVSLIDGVMKMRNLTDGLPLIHGETTILKPKDNHVMLFDLKQTFTAGEKVPFTLVFKEAGEVKIDVVIEKRNS